jgi:hypothetical protein
MSAYVPIAMNVFCASSISRSLKIRLCSSLILSRLLFNVQTWSKVTIWSLSKTNSVCVRVMRRIANATFCGHGSTLSDISVRRLLGAPSLDAIILERRLQHLGAMLQSGIGSLTAMLVAVSDGVDATRIPWTALVMEDMRKLGRYHLDKLADLGDPAECADRWMSFIIGFPAKWSQLVKSYLSCECWDHRHSCPECRAESGAIWSFASNKALQSHRRRKHGVRPSIRDNVDSFGTCPVCKTIFSSRLRVIAHLSEKRMRGRCAFTCGMKLVEGNYARLPSDYVSSLDGLDRTALTTARRAGRVQPLVRFIAQRSRKRASPDVQNDATSVPKRRRIRSKTSLPEGSGIVPAASMCVSGCSCVGLEARELSRNPLGHNLPSKRFRITGKTRCP